MKWNFFATSHGKGAVDGIGGTVKRSVWRQVRSGHVNINTPEQYAVVAQERNQNIHVHYISKADIEALETQLNEQWENVIPVPKTHQLHCFIPNGEETLKVSEISDSKEFTVVRIRKRSTSSESSDEAGIPNDNEESSNEAESNLAIGNWVLVNYDGKQFPGEITDILNSETDIEVNVMHHCGFYWK